MTLTVIGLSRVAAALLACGCLAQPISAQDGRATALELMQDGEVPVELSRAEAAAGPEDGAAGSDTVHVAPLAGATDADRLARQVVIYRDTYGVPHVHGRTDEAAVFGLAYARAEDQFELIEHIFLNRLGRAAEVHGDEGLLARDFARGRDLLVRAYRYRERARDAWPRLPRKIRALVEAYAAGLDHYLENHPEQEVRLLDELEPWWVLAVEDASESYQGMVHAGAFGADSRAVARGAWRVPGRGSNAWAVGPGRTAGGNAMLFMNPHDPSRFPYYECHVMSDEGLASYGVMNYWGALLLPYIGFNEHLGWSVTVNEPDLGDAYEMTFDHPTDALKYRFGDEYRTAETWEATVRVREGAGVVSRTVPFTRTVHGPVLATSENGRSISFRIARSPSGTLTEQLYRMHRATSLEEWKEAVALRGLTYHNLMYADRDGNVFYLYNGNVPVRDDALDWTRPVDGSVPRALWKGYHEIDELPQLLNPDAGYLQNANSSPFVTTHAENPDPADYPRYMTRLENGDTYRAQRSRELLRAASGITLDDLQDMATSTRLYAADEWLPLLFAEFDSLTSDDPRRERLRQPIAALQRWNRESSTESVETTLFVLWDEAYRMEEREGQRLPLIASLDEAVDVLEREFGTWKVPWRDVFRHQRRADADAVSWDESRPSHPTSANHGRYGVMFHMRGEPYEGRRESVTRRMTFGNSFVSIVEFTPFGPVARSIVAYGNSTDPDSPHYEDQAAMFARGGMKPVLFEMDDVLANLEESYRPGEREGGS